MEIQEFPSSGGGGGGGGAYSAPPTPPTVPQEPPPEIPIWPAKQFTGSKSGGIATPDG